MASLRRQAPGQSLQLQAVAKVQHHDDRGLARRQVVAARHGQQAAHRLGGAQTSGVWDRGLNESAAHVLRWIWATLCWMAPAPQEEPPIASVEVARYIGWRRVDETLLVDDHPL